MALSRPGIRRRIITLLLMLGFGLSSAEALIADACDGDSGLTTVSLIQGIDANAGSDAPSSPGHSMHVCHCVHVHGGLPARAGRMPAFLPTGALIVGSAALTPPSPALALQLRPPIV